jgi:hypothetical protein
MPWSRLALASSLPALLAVPVAAGEPDLQATVLWVEAVTVPGSVRDAMIREAADILGRVGVRLRWRSGPPGTESALEELRVVPVTTSRTRTKSGRMLGATSTDEGPRTIWIDYANVAWVAGTTTESLVSAGFPERRRVGVAMGRVIAHEVIHALVPDLPHAGEGVMGERLLGSLEKPASLDPGTCEAVRKALAEARRPEGEATASAR